MNVRIYLITNAITSIVHTRLRLPTETLLKGNQCRQEYNFDFIMLRPGSAPDVGGPK